MSKQDKTFCWGVAVTAVCAALQILICMSQNAYSKHDWKAAIDFSYLKGFSFALLFALFVIFCFGAWAHFNFKDIDYDFDKEEKIYMKTIVR